MEKINFKDVRQTYANLDLTVKVRTNDIYAETYIWSISNFETEASLYWGSEDERDRDEVDRENLTILGIEIEDFLQELLETKKFIKIEDIYFNVDNIVSISIVDIDYEIFF